MANVYFELTRELNRDGVGSLSLAEAHAAAMALAAQVLPPEPGEPGECDESGASGESDASG